MCLESSPWADSAAQRLDEPEVMNMIGAPKHVQKALEAKVTVIPKREGGS